jgi:hypothetical protein
MSKLLNKAKKKAEYIGHTANAYKEATQNGGIKSKKRTKYGVQYNYKNGTGYWVEK